MKDLNWQMNWAAPISHELTIPALSGIQMLKLAFDRPMIPIEWENGETLRSAKRSTNLSDRS